MKKIQENDIAFSTEGCNIYSAKLELMDKHIEGISKAKALISLQENAFIDTISISAWEVDVTQFDSTMDDEEREEIQRGAFDDFAIDCAVIMVSGFNGGFRITFRAFNKWDSSEYFEINLN